MQPFHVQLFDLTLMQLLNWRWTWRGTVIVGTTAPIVTTLALGIFAADSGLEALGYILTGNVVLSLLFVALGNVSSHFAYMRWTGRLDYFATLPIYRTALILATAIAFLILTLPSTLITLLVGALILKMPLVISPWIVIVLPVIGLSLSGLGAFIGLMGRNQQEVGNLTLLITLLLYGFGPVIIPPDRLPEVITQLSLLSPATYAASAVRQVVLGWSDRLPLVLDVTVLTGLAIVLMGLVTRRMDWREHV